MDRGFLRDTLRHQSIRYPLAGAMLAAGAPVGLLLTRRYLLRRGVPVREDLRRDLATYAYLMTSALLVFTVVGRALGRHADRLAELSATDPLTGLLNSRGFYPRLEHEIERSKRSGEPISLLVIDLDRLKQLNDENGHAAGDRALRVIGRAIRRELRSFDIGARLGGDEFGLLAVNTDIYAAQAVADRLRTVVATGAEERFNARVTVSIGVVTFDPGRDRLDDLRALTRAADSALYAAKRAGRNGVAFGTLEHR